MVCKTLVLYQRQATQVALVAMCMRATLAGSVGLDPIGTVFSLPLSLPYEMHH